MNYEQAYQYKDDFLTYLDVERNSAHNTYKSYQYDLEQFFTFWKTKRQQDATLLLHLQEALEAFFMHLYKAGIQKSSIARKIACFKSFEKYMHSCNIDIHLRLVTPRIERKLPTYLSIDEITYLLDQMSDKELKSIRPLRDRTVLELLYATGVRCSELCDIKLIDIDLDQKTILITGKGDKQRIVLFGDKAKERLLTYIQDERLKDVGSKLINNLFVTQWGDPLQDRGVQRILNKFSKRLGSKKQITPHKIRHTFATHLLNAGMDLRALQELLGHTSLATTERYTHVSVKDLKELYTTINPLAVTYLKNTIDV